MANYKHVIVADGGEQPDAGDVFLRRVRIRANIYRGHLRLEEVRVRGQQTGKLFRERC